MQDIIITENLSFRYEGSEFYSLHDINLKIKKGDFILLCGISGSGKTTLLRAFNGLIPNYYQGEYRGKVIVDGLEVAKHKTYEIAKIVGLVFQDPENQLFTSTVEKEIAFGLENLALPRDEMKKIVDEILRYLGLESLRKKSPAFLSGGEQQKVAIASILAMKPKVIALDESLSNLDPYSALNIVKLLGSLNKEMGITVIISEHRLDFLLYYANRIIVMKDGKVIIDGEIRNVLENYNLEEYGIGEPTVPKLSKEIRKTLNNNFRLCLTIEDFLEEFGRYDRV